MDVDDFNLMQFSIGFGVQLLSRHLKELAIILNIIEYFVDRNKNVVDYHNGDVGFKKKFLCSHHVPFKFPMGSHQVPNVFAKGVPYSTSL